MIKIEKQFTDNVKENGDVLYITIPKKICRVLKLKKEDFVDIIIKKSMEVSNKK